MKYTHTAWDYGVLWRLGKPKTTKTNCGRRVPVDQIDNRWPTCPDCQHYEGENARIAYEIALRQLKEEQK